MKRIITLTLALILSLTVLLAFASCGEDSGSGSEGKVSVKTIDSIEKYTIIRPDTCTKTVKNAASDLQRAFADTLDKMVNLGTDKKEETNLEILIGNTNRTLSGLDVSELNPAEYVIKLVGSKIVIAGGSDKATADAVNFFVTNLIKKESGARVPTGEGYSLKNENILSSVTIDGKPISEFAVVYRTFDDGDIAEDFASKIEAATYFTPDVVNHKDIDKISVNYILIEDTNPDFSKYTIDIENGNVIISANYYTLPDAIESFLTDYLGYNTASEKVTGAKEVALTSANNREYATEAKSPVYTKDKLMSVLEQVYNDDDMMIIGQQASDTSIGTTMQVETDRYVDACGVECAMYGYDIGTVISNTKNSFSAQMKDAYDMIEYMREGGLITFSVHFNNPYKLPEKEAGYRGELGHEDKWEELLTPGTEINTKFQETLTQVGDFLEPFKINNAPVIFRPLHEMNGNWFWFCIVNSNESGEEKIVPKEYAVRLWNYIYDYLVNDRGIDNMIWEYSPNVAKLGGGTNIADVMYCYPGDDKCDLIAVDWYPNVYTGHEPLADCAEHMTNSTGKIFSLAEFGPGEGVRNIGSNYTYTTANLDEFITEIVEDGGIKIAYWLAWSSWGKGDNEVKISMWNMGDGNLFYEDNDRYLDKEELKELLYS